MDLVAWLVLIAQNLGLGKIYPWSLLPWQGGRALWLVASAGLVLLLLRPALVSPAWRQRIAGWSTQRAFLIGVLACNAGMALLQYRYYAAYGYRFPWILLAVVAAGLGFVRGDRLWLAALLNVALLAGSMAHFPPAPPRSDMLPGIGAGLDAWSRGQSPYGALQFGTANPFIPYLPGTIFAHLPAWALGWDLRWNEMLYRVPWLVLLVWGARRLPARSGWQGVLHLLLLSPYLNYRHELYFDALLLLIVVYQAAPRWRWLLIPALCATHQWAWVVAPILALDWVCTGQTAGGPPWRRALVRGAALAAGSGVILGVVWLLLGASTTWQQFFGTIMILQQFALQAHWSGDYGLSLAPIFFELGLGRWLQPLQALIVLACAGTLLWRWRQGRWGGPQSRSLAVHQYGLMALLLFVMFNIHMWNYYWLTPALWMAALAVFPGAPAIEAVEPAAEPMV